MLLVPIVFRSFYANFYLNSVGSYIENTWVNFEDNFTKSSGTLATNYRNMINIQLTPFLNILEVLGLIELNFCQKFMIFCKFCPICNLDTVSPFLMELISIF